MKPLYFGMLLLAASALFASHESHAYTISVSCAHNPVPPPGQPYQNVLCYHNWSVGGDPADMYGKTTTTLQYWPGGGEVITAHHIETDVFSLSYYPSPNESRILCTNVSGSFRLIMNGYLYRLIIGGTWGSISWNQRDLQIDAEFAYVYTPLVTC